MKRGFKADQVKYGHDNYCSLIISRLYVPTKSRSIVIFKQIRTQVYI